MAAASEPGVTAAGVGGAAGPAAWHAPSLQLIYDTAPIGLAYLSTDCRYIHLNQHLTEICGMSVEDHLGRRVRDCVPALADAV
ncbi:MAG TPA: PAS domain-containing protein, partial [Caulobacteraceae bacterium]|nr:PAS domain-containing protein [Caulobacteraceae bacterium]